MNKRGLSPLSSSVQLMHARFLQLYATPSLRAPPNRNGSRVCHRFTLFPGACLPLVLVGAVVEMQPLATPAFATTL